MKLSLTRNELFIALSRVTGVVDAKKNQSTVLECVLLKAEDDQLLIVGTDLETEARDIADCHIVTTGSIATPSNKLMDSIKSIPNDAFVNLELIDDSLILTSGRKKFKLRTMPANDYPVLDSIDANNTLSVQEKEFRELLSNTAHSMAHQDVRYYLNGSYLLSKDNELISVSTDGHRLTRSLLSIECDNHQGSIIPRKAVNEIIKALSAKSDEYITMAFSDRHFQVVNNNYVFTTKLIDGKYPDWEQAIPRQITHDVSIDREALKSALTAVSVCSNEKFKGVRLKFNNNELHISSNNPNGEEARDIIEVDGFVGDEFEIGFNVVYLLESLNHSDDEFVNLSLTTPVSSAILSYDGSDTIHVLMPIRL